MINTSSTYVVALPAENVTMTNKHVSGTSFKMQLDKLKEKEKQTSSYFQKCRL